MNRFVFILACALTALIDRLRGRRLAVNSAPTETLPESLIGLPDGISGTAVAARKAALIAGGIPPLYATAFAIDAEQAQVARAAKLKGSAPESHDPAEREARAILEAQNADPSKAPTKAELEQAAKSLAAREETVAKAEQAARELAGKAQTDREAAEAALDEARRLTEAASKTKGGK